MRSVKYDSGAWQRNPDGFIGEPKQTKLEKQIVKIVKPLIKGGSVLDIGCIDGRYYEWLGKPKEYLGVDVTPHFVQLASTKYPEAVFQVKDARALDINRHFDVVLCLNVLMHLPDLEPIKGFCQLSNQYVVFSTYGSESETYETHSNGFLNFWYSVEDILAAIPEGWRIKAGYSVVPEWDKSKLLYQFVLEKTE